MRRNLSYYCLLAPRINIFVLRAHPVRGESHNQRNATGEVATVSNIPQQEHMGPVRVDQFLTRSNHVI